MIQIGTDFEGWAVKAHTLADILRQIGAEETENGFVIKKDNPLLNAYPLLLEDDGMAYGVNPQYVTEVDIDTYDNDVMTIDYVENKDTELGFDEVTRKETIKVFNIFRDVPENRIEESDEQ